MKNKSKQEKQFVNKQPPSEGILQNTKKKEWKFNKYHHRCNSNTTKSITSFNLNTIQLISHEYKWWYMDIDTQPANSFQRQTLPLRNQNKEQIKSAEKTRQHRITATQDKEDVVKTAI